MTRHSRCRLVLVLLIVPPALAADDRSSLDDNMIPPAKPNASIAMLLQMVKLAREGQVRKEVEIDDAQYLRLRRVEADQRRAWLNFSRNSRSAQPQERQAASSNFRKETTEALAETLEILTPRQANRLFGISIQLHGAASLFDQGVRDELHLTEEQITKLRTLRLERSSLGRVLSQQFKEGKITQEEILQKFGERRKEMHAKMLNVLTDHQRTHFQKMQGEKFELTDKQRASVRIPLTRWQFRPTQKKGAPINQANDKPVPTTSPSGRR